MRTYLVAYAATLAVFLLGDFVWLGTVALSFYRSRLGALLLDKPNLATAAGFYVLFAIGIVIFAVTPALRASSWTQAAIYGALFGFFSYATYDLTNLATIRGWSAEVSIADLIWGTAITAVSATAGYFVAARFG